MGVSAVNTGNNLIYLITAAFLSFLGVSGVFGKNNIAGVSVELGMFGETYANREFPLKVRVVNRQRFLPSFLIRVRIDATDIIFPYVGVGASEENMSTWSQGDAADMLSTALVSHHHFLSIFLSDSAVSIRNLNTSSSPNPKNVPLSIF